MPSPCVSASDRDRERAPKSGISSSRRLASLNQRRAVIIRSNSRIWPSVLAVRRPEQRRPRVQSWAIVYFPSATTPSSRSTPLRPTGATIPDSVRTHGLQQSVVAIDWYSLRRVSRQRLSHTRLGNPELPGNLRRLNASLECGSNCYHLTARQRVFGDLRLSSFWGGRRLFWRQFRWS